MWFLNRMWEKEDRWGSGVKEGREGGFVCVRGCASAVCSVRSSEPLSLDWSLVVSSSSTLSLCATGEEKPPLETPPSLHPSILPRSLLTYWWPPSLAPSIIMLLLYNCFLSLLESIYRRGARRWRKLYRVNGHLFQAKRFNRVSVVMLELLSHWWLTSQINIFMVQQTNS